MYVMLSKSMDSEKKLRLIRNMNLKVNKETEHAILYHPDNYPSKKSKRYRSAFTTEQVNYLETEFKKFPYICSGNRKEIADYLNISDRAVKIWFQNRRMREKKENNIKDVVQQSKSSMEKLKEPSQKGRNSETLNSCSRRQSKIDEVSNVTGICKLNENQPIEGICLSSQNKTKLGENINIKKKQSNYESMIDKQTKQDYSVVNRVSNMPHEIRKNTMIKSMPPPLQGNMCSYYDNIYKEYQQDSKSPMQQQQSAMISSSQTVDMPQDLSAKKKFSQKLDTPSHQYVSVHFNSDQKYIPLYTQNYCTTPVPIEATVAAGYSIQSGSTIPPGSIFWKPVNVLPGPGLPSIPHGIPHTNDLSINNQYDPNCTCNCHEPTQALCKIQGITQNAKTQPQYIIAIPLNTNNNKL